MRLEDRLNEDDRFVSITFAVERCQIEANWSVWEWVADRSKTFEKDSRPEKTLINKDFKISFIHQAKPSKKAANLLLNHRSKAPKPIISKLNKFISLNDYSQIDFFL